MNNDTIHRLVNIIYQNNLFFANNLIFSQGINSNELSFLQKKRRLEYPNLIQNNQISFQKEINFCIEKSDILNNNNIQSNECLPKEDGNFEFCSKLIIPKLKNDNNSNLNEIESNNSSINISNTDKDNKHEFNKNININNLVYNIDENPYVDCSNLKNINEKIKENINENINENNNSIDSTNSQIQYNNTALKKNNFFNVIHPKNQNYKKKITKKYINQGENNNEIKVLKNNKVVYVNTYLLNSYSTSKNIKKLNKIAFIGRNKRSSKYRGVSKNGNQWQVLMMLNKNKSYIGSYPSEELAARIYDILAIKNRGIKARTNFIYNSKQLKRICEIDIDIKSKNISEIISQLTN